MPLVLIIARLVLFSVFAVAGVAKLADQPACARMLGAFGVPPAFTKPFAVLLPTFELIVALALLPLAFAWYAAVAALLLLIIFLGGIAFNLSRGRTPDCNCFGQIHSAPIGSRTVIRNLVLAAVAVLIVVRGRQNAGPGVLESIRYLAVAPHITLLSEFAIVILLAIVVALVFQLLRQQGRILVRLDRLDTQLSAGVPGSPLTVAAAASSRTATGLQIGSPAPAFTLASLDGRRVSLASLLALQETVALLFTNPNCGPCSALMPDVAAWQRQHSTSLTIALISEGTVEENRAKSATHQLTHLLLQQEREVAETYHVWGTPAAVLVHADGTIGSYIAQGAEAIRTLIAQAASARPAFALPNGNSGQNGHIPKDNLAASQVKVGDSMPALDLSDLTGNHVTPEDFRGRNTLLLFWNPACGFCQQMLEDLRHWEMYRPPDAPALLLVSTGSIADNRIMGLHSRVAMDHTRRAGPAFGAHGTPMGVLIDAQGRIASDVVAGAEAVLALANAGTQRPVLPLTRN